MGRKSDSPVSGPQGWASTHQWISRFLEDKTTPRKIVQWHNWARGRMEQGWSRIQVEDRIRAAWHTHELTHDVEPLEPELQLALAGVLEQASAGWTPAQCAVVYRSLYRQHPSRHWLGDWAERWEKAGTDWKAVVLP